MTPLLHFPCTYAFYFLFYSCGHSLLSVFFVSFFGGRSTVLNHVDCSEIFFCFSYSKPNGSHNVFFNLLWRCKCPQWEKEKKNNHFHSKHLPAQQAVRITCAFMALKSWKLRSKWSNECNSNQILFSWCRFLLNH